MDLERWLSGIAGGVNHCSDSDCVQHLLEDVDVYLRQYNKVQKQGESIYLSPMKVEKVWGNGNFIFKLTDALIKHTALIQFPADSAHCNMV